MSSGYYSTPSAMLSGYYSTPPAVSSGYYSTPSAMSSGYYSTPPAMSSGNYSTPPAMSSGNYSTPSAMSSGYYSTRPVSLKEYQCLCLEETNRLRAQLGLKPLLFEDIPEFREGGAEKRMEVQKNGGTNVGEFVHKPAGKSHVLE
jgi:hypothetical protein